MKRTISLLLIAAMLLMLFPLQSFAEETADTTITVQSAYAYAGSTVTVKVSIANNPGILCTTLQLSYDEGLSLVGADSGEALSYLELRKPGTFSSPCSFAWDGQEADPSKAADGTILTLTFQVAEDVMNGSGLGVHITAEDGDTYDNNLNPVDVTITDGTVNVLGYIPGDLDGDGKINTKDVILMRRYLADSDQTTVNKHAVNVNNDTKYNTADLITLRRYLAGDYGIDVLYPDPNPGEVSDWILAADAPKNAQIVGRKWTYTQRNYTTGSSSSMSGWTLYNTARTSWGTTQGPVYSNPSNGSRNVWSEQYVTSSTTYYHYYRYSNVTAEHGGESATSRYGTCTNYVEITTTYALSTIVNSYGTTCYCYYYNNGANYNWYWPCSPYTTTSNTYGTRWYYQEPVYTYYFYQDVSGESDSCPTGDNISNVQEWVQYQD